MIKKMEDDYDFMFIRWSSSQRIFTCNLLFYKLAFIFFF